MIGKFKATKRCQYSAVVDWVEMEIDLSRSTNFQTVQRVLRRSLRLPSHINPYVTAMNEGAGGAATIFRFRLQDPRAFHVISRVLEDLQLEFGFNMPVNVTAIEVAFDVYQSTPEMAARLYRSCSKSVSSNNRSFRKPRIDIVKSIPLRIDAITTLLADGWQLGIGNKNDDEYQHIYWKMTDDSGTPIPSDRHRARLEITLRGAALPSPHLSDWQNFNFRSLSKYFRFRIARPGLTPLKQLCVKESPSIAHRKLRKVSDGGTRLYSASMMADCALNERAGDALKDLSRRWKTEPKPGRRTMFTKPTTHSPAPLTRGKPGELIPASACKPDVSPSESNNYLLNKDISPIEPLSIQINKMIVDIERQSIEVLMNLDEEVIDAELRDMLDVHDCGPAISLEQLMTFGYSSCSMPSPPNSNRW